MALALQWSIFITTDKMFAKLNYTDRVSLNQSRVRRIRKILGDRLFAFVVGTQRHAGLNSGRLHCGPDQEVQGVHQVQLRWGRVYSCGT